jgi:hypothetical protein
MFRKHLEGMSYREHFVKNIKVTGQCFKIIVVQIIVAMLHLFHALFPCTLTDHHYWNI